MGQWDYIKVTYNNGMSRTLEKFENIYYIQKGIRFIDNKGDLDVVIEPIFKVFVNDKEHHSLIKKKQIMTKEQYNKELHKIFSKEITKKQKEIKADSKKKIQKLENALLHSCAM